MNGAHKRAPVNLRARSQVGRKGELKDGARFARTPPEQPAANDRLLTWPSARSARSIDRHSTSTGSPRRPDPTCCRAHIGSFATNCSQLVRMHAHLSARLEGDAGRALVAAGNGAQTKKQTDTLFIRRPLIGGPKSLRFGAFARTSLLGGARRVCAGTRILFNVLLSP